MTHSFASSGLILWETDLRGFFFSVELMGGKKDEGLNNSGSILTISCEVYKLLDATDVCL